MIVLKESQSIFIDNHAIEDFAAKVLTFIQHQHPNLAENLSNEQLHTFCTTSTLEARDERFITEWDACRYCWLKLAHGEQFPESLAWSNAITEHEDYSSSYKMDLLEHYHVNFLQ